MFELTKVDGMHGYRSHGYRGQTVPTQFILRLATTLSGNTVIITI
jgi:hypothetical protein